MKIAIMGSGGVGGYLGARLADQGHDVFFVARGAHLAAMQAKGLRLDDKDRPIIVNPAQATDDPATIGPVDTVIFSVKVYDAQAAIAAMTPLIGPNTVVLDVLNGVESHQWLVDTFGAAHVLRGSIYISSHIAEPGVIVHETAGVRLVFGALDPAGRPAAEAFLAAVAAFGVKAVLTDDVESAIWSKMVMLTALSGICCLARLPIRDVMAEPEGAELVKRAMQEVAAVAAARKITLEPGALGAAQRFDPTKIPAIKPSMLHDLERGKPLEVKWLSGAISRFGREVGVPTPTHDVVWGALKPWANGGRG
ncbi:MAG: 2-dehydropantoate 2-reductase [Proteobacteria bacterium]|nr:2-dehydropantoate 2-reductase [Pseudomonadota bacterium]MDA1058690.1 2-dehydropantoate 2-reductase [Pseudomonadota bacterium]